MAIHNITATSRAVEGKGASRRLRRSGQVPAIVYGAKADPQNVQLEHNALWLASQNEWFYSSILTLGIDGKDQKVLLRDMQRHPFKQQIMHLDFQRIDENEAIRFNVPLHFLNQATSPAGKTAGVVVPARAQRDRRQLPAEAPAGVHRGRPREPRAGPEPAPVRPQAAGRREPAGTEAGQGARRRGR
jgi:ribosomal protein bL25 (Ctc-form)